MVWQEIRIRIGSPLCGGRAHLRQTRSIKCGSRPMRASGAQATHTPSWTLLSFLSHRGNRRHQFAWLSGGRDPVRETSRRAEAAKRGLRSRRPGLERRSSPYRGCASRSPCCRGSWTARSSIRPGQGTGRTRRPGYSPSVLRSSGAQRSPRPTGSRRPLEASSAARNGRRTG